VCTERRWYWLAGVLFAFAALIKVWPLLRILVWLGLVPLGRRPGFLAAAGVVGLAWILPVVLVSGRDGLLRLAQLQVGRGVELESILAFPIYMIITLTVNQAPAITNVVVAMARRGRSFSFQATATGFPTPTWSATGSLPPGLTISSSGLISGTPMANGPYHFTLVATNSTGTATQAFTIAVTNPG
jgi:hypothetical protein